MPAATTTEAHRPYAGQSPARRDAERRQRLCLAALELFGSQGYHATSMRDLCAEARVSSRHFYQLFADREALLTAVYDQIIGEATAAAAQVLGNRELDPQARVLEAIAAYLRTSLRERSRARVMFVECLAVSPAFERHRRSVMDRLAGLISAEQQRMISGGLLPEDTGGYGAIGVLGAIAEIVIEWLHRDCPHEPEELIEHVVAFVETVLVGSRVRQANATN